MSSSVGATGPEVLTPAWVSDLWAPSRPVLSSDARRLAWTMAPHGREGEHDERSLWVADLTSGEPARRWTRGHDDQDPAWSPDGLWLAFRSDRVERGRPGLHVLDVGGGEARALVERARAVGAFAWTPDGTALWFLAPDEPGEEDERREREHDDPDVWGERWEHQRLWRVPVSGGEARRVWAPDRHVDAVAVSPSGRLALVTRRSPLLEHAQGSELWVAAADGGGARRVAAAPFASDVAWWGDGTVVFRASHDLRPQGGGTAWAVDAGADDVGADGEARAPRVVGTRVDEPRCTSGLAANGSGALVVVADGVATRVETLARDGGGRRVLVEVTGDLRDPALGDDGRLAVVLDEPRRAVGRVAVVEPDGTVTAVPVADVPGSDPDVPLVRASVLTATSADGTKLEAVVLRPDDAGAGPWPTVVLPHGGPYGRDTLDAAPYPLGGGWGQLLAARGYAVLLPNYRGSLGRGHDFAAQARGRMGGPEWADVEACVDAAVAAGIADGDRLGIGGWSQGGFLTAWAVTATDRYRAAVMGAGVSDWSMMAATSDLPDFEAELGGSTPWDGPGPHRAATGSPISYAARRTTPLLILHGAEDARVPASQAVAFHRALERADPAGAVPLSLVLYPREPHGVRERRHQVDLQERVLAWFERFLR
ncbi:prolyl oligopeptidase family serine peptidase [Lapillicoccus jejuensis]|uniref:Dipeptidyl aminopeptidase/acylaminoacyl peptidase n=1 Tax=Lapillicoccus jejuensis TaxID=402171 RepID=A0A542E0R2_9MICO|nr:prolyl oligopeptidase family serine peptidase [Lapillicoccus jejuensis]TQJ08933.1 dipeptidyl aminopeptidase/acylaminoacyl peptidase [Lapillicoccus jejuensis]